MPFNFSQSLTDKLDMPSCVLCRSNCGWTGGWLIRFNSPFNTIQVILHL